MNDAILLAAIGLMGYGLVLCMLNGDDFWFHPIGNIVGAIAVSVIATAALPIMLQDGLIIFVSTALVLFWVTKGKRTRRPTAPTGKATFNQIFITVPVDEPPAAVVEPDVEPDVDPVEPDDEPAPVPTAPTGVFMWNGR